jgi:exopolysaccharide biosynthesis polyprenyl glycosylphosphotransferase
MRCSLVLGTGERARRMAAALEAQGSKVCGFLDDAPLDGDRELLGDLYLGDLRQLPALASRFSIEQAVFALPRRFLSHESTANAIGLCEMLGISVTIPFDLFDTRVLRPVPGEIGGIPVVTYAVSGHRPGVQLAIKRLIDVVGATVVLLLTSPLWLIAMIAIKLDSRGPVFFVQDRCGRYGRLFRFLKFRTMYDGADEDKLELLMENEQSGPVFKIRDDPRVTRVGRFMRRYSIDELPQLVNVLRGDMSLVGPRPPVPGEVNKYEIDHRGRLSMRPGITCLWQVSGRNEIAFGDWVKLDLEYIERWSLRLDLEILVMTVPAVLSGRGAS